MRYVPAVLDVAAQLREVPLFAGVPANAVDAVAERATRRHLDAGEWLFHEGDPGETLYLVTAGSVDLFAEQGSGTGSVAVRGETIGELSLLTGQPRSAAARARRDTELIVISRGDFDEMLTAYPGFASALVRVLSERLRRVAPPPAPQRRPSVLAVVALHAGAPVAAVADALAARLSALGSLVRRDGGPMASDELDRMEAANNRVLLVAASSEARDEWTEYCVRQADRVIGVATRPYGGTMPPQALDSLRGCDLAFQAAPGVEPDLSGWLDALQPRALYLLRAGSDDGAARMARRLAGVAVGVVLSGGGARGLAHIGVVEELQRAGVVLDRIGGVSMGASVGSLFAEQRPVDEVAEVIDSCYVRDTPLRGRTIPIVALSRGLRGFETQHRVHGERLIEGLDTPFYCVSSDLAAQQPVVHRRGLVAVAVSASQALPAFVPPVQDGERMLIDGAIFSNLPVEPMRETGEGPVIAVDVSGRLPPPRPPRSRLPFVRRWIAGPAAEWAPPITETVLRSILLGNVASDAAARERADVVIQPKLRGVATMRFRDLDGIRRLGREAVQDAIAAGALQPLGIS
jgi:predicted acylesterase/phospholipase RssA